MRDNVKEFVQNGCPLSQIADANQDKVTYIHRNLFVQNVHIDACLCEIRNTPDGKLTQCQLFVLNQFLADADTVWDKEIQRIYQLIDSDNYDVAQVYIKALQKRLGSIPPVIGLYAALFFEETTVE